MPHLICPQYEAWFVGWTHEDHDIDQTVKAAKKAFDACR